MSPANLGHRLHYEAITFGLLPHCRNYLQLLVSHGMIYIYKSASMLHWSKRKYSPKKEIIIAVSGCTEKVATVLNPAIKMRNHTSIYLT